MEQKDVEIGAVREDASPSQVGSSIPELAREHQVHRRTVRDAIASATPPPRKVPERASPALGPFKDTIRGLLTDDLKVPPKQRLIVHSDRGSQYRSRKFRAALRRHGLVQSMGAVGACGDNAAMESLGLLQGLVASLSGGARRRIGEFQSRCPA